MYDYSDVNLQELKDFQESLLLLSKQLSDYYENVSRVINMTGQNWRDPKFCEFENDFRRYKENILQISKDYELWAKGYLQNHIDILEDYRKLNTPVE